MQIAPRQTWEDLFIIIIIYFFFMLQNGFSVEKKSSECSLEGIKNINKPRYVFSAYDKIGILVYHRISETKQNNGAF